MATRLATSTVRSQTADKAEIDEFVQSVEDRTAQFVGSEFCAARLIAYVSAQSETGQLSQERAGQLLQDAYHLAELIRLGHQAHKWLRNPPAQLTMLVPAQERR